MEIIWKWNYYYLNFTPDFHFLIIKWNSQRAKTTLPYINPFYPIPSPPIEWTIWPVNEFYYSNYILIVYCWQFFSCPKIHVYYISIIDDHEKFVFKWKKNHQTLSKSKPLVWNSIIKLFFHGDEVMGKKEDYHNIFINFHAGSEGQSFICASGFQKDL